MASEQVDLDGPDAIWREPARGELWDPSLIAVAGLDRLRAFVRGELPTAPLEHLTGIVPVEAGVGTMTFAMPASRWFMSATGAYLGGILAMLADAPLACAILSGLPAGVAVTTQELSLHFLRVASPSSERLIALGRIIHGGRAIGLSEVSIHDSAGRLMAYGTSRCVTVSVAVPPAAPSLVAARETLGDWVPPIRRPVRGQITPTAAMSGHDGLTLMNRWLHGELPLAAMQCLFGARSTAVSRGSATAEMPASGWLANAAGVVYGGALAMFVDLAMNFAATSIVSAGQSYVTLDLKVNFLRPVKPDGQILCARANVFHAGKTMIVVNGEVIDAAGRQVVVATGTHMLQPEPFRSLDLA